MPNEMKPAEVAEYLNNMANRLKPFQQNTIYDNEIELLRQAAANERKIASRELIPTPVKCRECKYQNTEDCPVIEFEFITPYDTERTLFTAFSDDGFCAHGERKDGDAP